MFDSDINIIQNKFDGIILSSKYDQISKFVKVKSTLSDKQKKSDSMITQTIILSKDRFKSKQEAINWIKASSFKYKTIDETESSYRFRQENPSSFTEGTFRTKSIDKGVSIVMGRLKNSISKFSSVTAISTISKFTNLPNDIKSDLDIPIPLNIELWVLKEGVNRDGIIPYSELVGSLDKCDDVEIIPYHDMDDMENVTKYGIDDECGITYNPQIRKDEDGYNWLVMDGKITNRNIAYQMYLRTLKNRPIEISAEYSWRASYDEEGNIIQTNIRPQVISLVNKGHMKGNKIIVKDNL